MTVVDAHTSLWEALAGRGPDRPLPADATLWQQVAERINPARAQPELRDGIEQIELASARGGRYVMLRSPDRVGSYVRLTPAEAELASRMDGTRTVAQLVGEFARLSGQLAPERVSRVVADLAGGRMLTELPANAFQPLERLRKRPWPARLARGFAAAASGRRMLLANPDRAAGFLYRAGGRLLFTRAGFSAMVVVSVAGFAVFVRSWASGAGSALTTGRSYAVGALVLLGMNVLGLLCHESGHALGAKHAGRRVPALGLMCYFGIPCAYVDTTDMWMAPRRQRLITTAAGPGFSITFAGAVQLLALAVPPLTPVAFPLGFAWYLNSLFNLNPLMALDGYYLVMDWLEVPNLRPRAVAFVVTCIRRPATILRRRTGEERLVALYAVLSFLWIVVFAAVMVRIHRDRLSGLWAGLWHRGWGPRLLFLAVVAMILAPFVWTLVASVVCRVQRWAERARERRRDGDEPRRLDALRGTQLGGMPPDRLTAAARVAYWVRPRRGSELVAAGAAFPGVIAIVSGALQGRRPGDPGGVVRARGEAGDVVGAANVLTDLPSSLSWTAAGTRLLVVPPAAFATVTGPPNVAVPVDPAELETLFDEAPALATMTPEDRAALLTQAAASDLPPDHYFRLTGDHVTLVGSGVVVTDSGQELRRGDLVAPTSDGPLGLVTKTRTRLWGFPATSALVALVGVASNALPRSAAFNAPTVGMHGDDSPPLPPAPPGAGDAAADDRLARRFGMVLTLLLLIVLFAIFAMFGPAQAWDEIPEDTALLVARDGTVDAVVDGRHLVLRDGARVVVGRDDHAEVAPRSTGVLVFRGGAEAVLCAGTRVGLGPLSSDGEDPTTPAAALDLERGTVIADTESATSAFEPVELAVDTDLDTLGGVVANDGDAYFATTPTRVAVVYGIVARDGRRVRANARTLSCGRRFASTDEEPTTTTSTTTTTLPLLPSPSLTVPKPGGGGGDGTVPTAPPDTGTTPTTRRGPTPTTTTRPGTSP